MTAGNLIKLIPEKVLQDLAVETKVDTQVKKLSGEVMFKLILYSMFNSEKLSLRVMETFLHSAKFKAFSKYDIVEGKYNSIRDRICTINADYFEKLFANIFSVYNKELKEEKALSKTDSTMVGLSAKLLSAGMDYTGDDNRYIKYGVNIKGSLPSLVKIYTEKKYASENIALAEVIENSDCIEGNIVVFDRGLQARGSYDKFTDSNKLFVTRANPNVRCKSAIENELIKAPDNSTITVVSDKTGYLINKKEQQSKHKYRVIKATTNKTDESIFFVTNMLDENAYTIAAWYKQRWEIEIFFKFIKQYLNVKHLVSRDINGIKVMIYMTMILAILLIAYKKINHLKGFKIAKLKFEIELENEIIKEIVVLCGGNPQMAPHLFNSG